MRDWWLEDGEKAILDFHAEHPLEGYRRLAFMMLDTDVVTVSLSNVYRVLSDIDMPRMDGIQLVGQRKRGYQAQAVLAGLTGELPADIFALLP